MNNNNIQVTDIYERLRIRESLLEKIVLQTEIFLNKTPRGWLYVSENKGRPEYYQRWEQKEKSKQYIRKSNLVLIKKLAQKRYLSDLHREAGKELEAIRMFLEQSQDDSILNAYKKLPQSYKALSAPVLVDDRTYIAEWNSYAYQPKHIDDDAPSFFSDKGEKMRSKSEVLIANALKKLSIPYRYECPLKFQGGITIYPDFTVLKIKTRENLYWEHLGMMDDMEYVKNAMRKIDIYRDNGIYPGTELILTHEMLRKPLGTKDIELFIRKYLL